MDIPFPPPLETQAPDTSETSAYHTRDKFYSVPKAVIVAFIRSPVHAERQSSLANNANVRTVEYIGGHHAPEPLRPSEWRGMARAPGHEVPRQQKFVSDNLRAVLSTMRDSFGASKFDAPVHVAHSPTGSQLAWRERVNMERRAAQAYGDLFTLAQPNDATAYFPRTNIGDANAHGY